MGWLILASLPWVWRKYLRPGYAPSAVDERRKIFSRTPAARSATKPQSAISADTALINLSARLQAGQSVQAAMAQSLDPINAPWAGYVRAKISGVNLPTPFPQKISPTDSQAVHAVSGAAQLVHQYGMELSAILHASVQGIVASQEAEQQRSSALAGPRATARLLQWLPVAAVVAGTIIGADPIGVLLSGGWGNACLIAGVGFMLAGRMWLTRLIRMAERGELSTGRAKRNTQ